MRRARTGTLVAVAALVAGLLGAGGPTAGAGGSADGGAPARAAGVSAGVAVKVAADVAGVASAAGIAGVAGVAADDCDTGASLPPGQRVGAKIQEIRRRGRLVVGVDQSAYNWGYRDSQTGRIEGFDIDLARAVAESVLGDPDKVVLKTVSTADRINVLKDHQVDLIARAMTVTCERKKQIAFSAPYFKVSQRVVAPKAAHATSVAQALGGKRVCAALNSSSHTELKADPHGAASVVTPDNQLDCLVLMELGEADATLSDSSLAAAMVAQDRTMELAGESFLPTYMGVGMNQDDTDLVSWVNQVLVEWRGGGWQASYDTWLRPSMGVPDPYRPW
ncbi:polar amino acid transport system substrate-binding protein [Kitasatospora sp. SolWspMP-SS2h]|uniref:glutamate ABC transporter substrate-binding protein n=1 Tax=Kitasatospora sp. SolWspMP-SS2h TaxID=1305729 RepID=UPI000DBFDD9E|nr:glutamate ABC transporter substrate-binding protein [Kitasatospora sp. SolWspMP-SS2h]RAJ44262.1 polar amino acid transport system substrate-binding protein [Kitasatospora sp. SolWspMP-SS2h]